MSLPDEDFLLLQLHYVRRYFRTFESALPLIPDHMELRAGESGLVRAIAADASGEEKVVLRVDGIEFRPPTAAIEEFRIGEEKAQSMALVATIAGAGPRLDFDEWGSAIPAHTPYKSGGARAEKRGNTRHRSAVVGDRAKERKANRKRAASLRAVARLSQKLRASAFSQVRFSPPPPSLSLSLRVRAPRTLTDGALAHSLAPFLPFCLLHRTAPDRRTACTSTFFSTAWTPGVSERLTSRRSASDAAASHACRNRW